MRKTCRTSVALGGGGGRGLAHLGVLQFLERQGIQLDLITGTSMGALVGAVYALTPQCDLVIERFRIYLQSREFQKTNPDFLNFHNHEEGPGYDGIFQRFASFIRKGVFYTQSLTKRAPVSEENFAQNINFMVDDVEIQETRIPLAVIALDLQSAEEVVLRKGSLRKAVRASCAIPGILPPVDVDGRELIDGGWINRVPIRPAREMGADLVIAVNVTEGLDDMADLRTGLGIAMRANDISRCALSHLQLREADVVISPDVSHIHWSDFGHLDECLLAGQKAALGKIEAIRSQIRKKKLKNIFLPFSRQRSSGPTRNEC